MIKIDIDMPKDCDSCPLYSYNHDEADTCCITHENLMNVDTGKRHKECPLIYVIEANNKHVQALTRIKDQFESVCSIDLNKDEEVRTEYESIIAGIEALKHEIAER